MCFAVTTRRHGGFDLDRILVMTMRDAARAFVTKCDDDAQRPRDSFQNQTVQHPFMKCVPQDSRTHAGMRDAILFLGPGSTGTSTIHLLCSLSGRRSYHTIDWQDLLSRHLPLRHQILLNNSECFSDGLATSHVSPERIHRLLANSSRHGVFVLNSRPLFSWVLSQLIKALRDSRPGYPTHKHLASKLAARDGLGAEQFVNDLIENKAIRDGAVLSYRATLPQQKANDVLLLDATTEEGLLSVARLLNLNNMSRHSLPHLNPSLADPTCAFELQPSFLSRSAEIWRPWNLSSVKAVKELVAHALLRRWPEHINASAHELHTSGVCGCPPGHVAIADPEHIWWPIPGLLMLNTTELVRV